MKLAYYFVDVKTFVDSFYGTRRLVQNFGSRMDSGMMFFFATKGGHAAKFVS